MIIVISVLTAAVSYCLLCAVANTYFELDIQPPKRFIMSDRANTIISAVCAVLIGVCAFFKAAKLPTERSVMMWLFLMFMAAAAITDIRKKVIPNKLVLLLLLTWLGYAVVCFAIYRMDVLTMLRESIIGFLFALLVFGTGYLLMKGKLGGGDVKLTAVMGLVLTSEGIFGAMIYALFLSLFFAIGAMLSGKMKAKDSMPFAPFLFIGSAVAIILM